MARVVVVGGGLGGIATAARLAKLNHEVTLVEASPEVGGAFGVVEQDGFSWDAGPTSFTMPAVLRDLFRKSGRPLETELGTDLEPLELVREHRFVDGTAVQVPGSSRVAHQRAFDALAPGLGQAWNDHVQRYNGDWEVLRRHYLEVPWEPDAVEPATAREVRARLDSRETLRKRLRRSFRDERLALVAAHPFVADGHDPRDVPAWAGLVAYLEQAFGTWRVPAAAGGMPALTAALGRRLSTRKVVVLTGTHAIDLVVRDGRVAAVRTTGGELDAEVVVCAIDPRRLPALAPHVAHTMPAIPPVVCHLGLEGELPDLAPEVVLHDDPLLVVRTGGRAPEGRTAWTLHGRGKLAEDPVQALARQGIDVRDQVVTRVDLSPRDLVERWGGSPHGVLWQGRGTVRRRLGPRTPIDGVYAAGAHATPGGGIPWVGLSAALVAQCVGAAERRSGA